MTSLRRAFGNLNSASKAVVVGLVFAVVLAVTWQATVIPTEITDPEINPNSTQITTWPAGPLAGVPPLLVGSEVDLDGCASLDTGDSIELVPHTDASAVWMFAEPSDKVRLEWRTTAVEQSILVPDEHFANESSQGRVTVTLAAREQNAIATVTVPAGSARICGVQDTAGPNGGPLEEAELISSWPAGPLVGNPPVVNEGIVAADGCADVAEGATITAIPDIDTSAIWVFADPEARVRVEWTTAQLDQSLIIPPQQFANETAQGRVTLTLAGRGDGGTVTLESALGTARVCGIQAG